MKSIFFFILIIELKSKTEGIQIQLSDIVFELLKNKLNSVMSYKTIPMAKTLNKMFFWMNNTYEGE